MLKKISEIKDVLLGDRWLLIGTMLLLAMGILMVASASLVISDRQFGTPFHYLFRQVLYLGAGIFIIYYSF